MNATQFAVNESDRPRVNRRAVILTMLGNFIRSRPGLDFANYGDVSLYRSEARSIAMDKRHAETLLSAVTWREGIDADALVRAASSAFSGRLNITERDDGRVALDYCTGQYYPTEYRKAACAVLASALWDYTREHAMPAPTYIQHGSASDTPMRTEARYDGLSAGDWLRRYFRREFGRTIASRYFN